MELLPFGTELFKYKVGTYLKIWFLSYNAFTNTLLKFLILIHVNGYNPIITVHVHDDLWHKVLIQWIASSDLISQFMELEYGMSWFGHTGTLQKMVQIVSQIVQWEYFPKALPKSKTKVDNRKFAAENDFAILSTSNRRRVSQYSHWWSIQALPATITVDRLPQIIVSTDKLAHNFTLPIPENRTVTPGHYYLCIPNRTTFWHALSEMVIWLYNLLMLSSRWY